MNKVIVWYSGFQNFKKHTFEINPETKTNNYCIELLDTEIPNIDRNIFDIFGDYFSIRQNKFVEVLYSGGMDSELILYACLIKKIPVKALTMRILIDDVVLNTYDLYYSEKFCRQYNVEQKIIDFDATIIFLDLGNESWILLIISLGISLNLAKFGLTIVSRPVCGSYLPL
jgi:hypothetical protein